MEIRQLRYFLTVAEHGSIAAASRLLHIAQPALSRQMALLEADVGCPLFERLPRGVALTRAGKECEAAATKVLHELSNLRKSITAAAGGKIGTLRIGVMPGHSVLPVLRHVLEELASESPRVSVAVETQMALAQLTAIKQGVLDAGFVAWRSPLDSSLTGDVIFRDQMVVAIPRSMAAASRPVRRLEQLANKPFISFVREGSPSLHDLLMRAFTEAGITIMASPTAADLPTLMGLVSSGLGYAMVPASFSTQCPENVRLQTLPDLDVHFDVELVRRKNNEDPVLKRFVDAARRCGGLQ